VSGLPAASLSREKLTEVAIFSLNRFDVIETGGVKELSTTYDINEFGLGPKRLGDTSGHFSLPSGTCDQKRSSVVPGGASTQIIEVEGIKVLI